MNPTQADWLALVGRIFLGLVFVIGGIGQATNLAGATAYAAANGMPMANIAVILGCILQIGGGLLLITGFYARIGALALFVFIVAAIIVFHRFWEKTGPAAASDQVSFLKDLAMAGGMLYVMAFGPGRLSVNARRGA